MLEMLIRFVFEVVTTITSAFMTPFINVIIGMFPDVQVHFDNILTFFTNGFTYLNTILRWFLFTPEMFMVLFNFFIIKWSIWVVSAAVRCAFNIYQALKP